MKSDRFNLTELSNDVRDDASRYIAARVFLQTLRGHQRELSNADFLALRRRAISGDVAGAEKSLLEILMKQGG